MAESWKHQITIEVDENALGGVTDETLALWWHVVQANPADGHANPDPGNLAEKVGREIIRRWLKGVEPELWHHQGRHYYWKTASDHGNWPAPERMYVPFEPIADPRTVMRALELGAAKATEVGDVAEADRYEQILRQMQAQEKKNDA